MTRSEPKLKRCLLLVALLSSPVPALAAVNGGFEAGGGSFSGWDTFNNFIPNVVITDQTVRSGTAAAKIFGGFNGNPNAAGLSQSLPAQPGEIWQASAYVRHNSNDTLWGSSNRLMLKIEFYRVAGGVYGTSDMLEEHEVLALDAFFPEDSWQLATLKRVAPAETVEARIALVFLQYDDAPGAAIVDDVVFSNSSTPEPIEWELLWADEFDGVDVDETKWRVEDLHLNKNNELQYYTPEDVYLENGDLVLRSQHRTYQGFDSDGNWRTFQYTSGLIESIDRFATTYGRVEVRAKLPSTQGIWPAHWMLPASGFWPPEIDIVELLGHEPTRIYMTHHWGTWPNVVSDGGDVSGPDFSADYHTFAVEWMPGRLDWYVDDVLSFESTSYVPKEPFYIILNTAVGGNWPGDPDGTTVFPQLHRIDYVRVSVPVEMGEPVLELNDQGPAVALVDGRIDPGEYFSTIRGINGGFGDLIGAASNIHFESGGSGEFVFAIDGATAWPQNWSGGVVIYIDSREGGLASTYELTDDSDLPRRMVSGTSLLGARSDLYFAPGFRADYAVAMLPDELIIYELDPSGLQVVNGAMRGAATDFNSGTAVAYDRDDGAAGFRIREFAAPLAAIGVAPGASFDFVMTLINGDTASRSSEFVGVAPGNAWDLTNVGVNAAVLKIGDYVRVTTSVVAGQSIPAVSDWGALILSLLLLCAATQMIRGTTLATVLPRTVKGLAVKHGSEG